MRTGGPPVIAYALGSLASAGAQTAYVVLREDKADIRDAAGDGSRWQIDVEYVFTPSTPSAVHSVDQAFSRIRGQDVVLAYPDIFFDPYAATRELVEHYYQTGADLALALFPSDRPDKVDMVRLDDAGRPVELVIKEPDCDLRMSWALAVWGPRFTDLLHSVVMDANLLGVVPSSSAAELFVGDVIRLAIRQGFTCEAVCFPKGIVLDIGTRDDLERVRNMKWQGF